MRSEPQLCATTPGSDAEIRCRDGVRIAVRGQLVAASRDRLTRALDKACCLSGDVTLDAIGLRFCDASGISVLLAAYNRMHASGRHFAVINTNDLVHRVLDLAGVAYLRGVKSQ